MPLQTTADQGAPGWAQCFVLGKASRVVLMWPRGQGPLICTPHQLGMNLPGEQELTNEVQSQEEC